MLSATILLQASTMAGPFVVLILIFLFVLSLPLFIVAVPLIAVLITRVFQKLGTLGNTTAPKQSSVRGQPVIFILSLLLSAAIILFLWWLIIWAWLGGINL